MTGQVLSIILDLAVLIGLGFTIFYCLRLSRSMNNFRSHRQEMSKLIDNLSKNIDEALRAIDGLKIAGDRSGRDLQKIINNSRSMAEELQMINETSNSLASRLENLAGQTSVSPQIFEETDEFYDEPQETAPRNTAAQKPAFYIHDRDYNDDAPVNDDDDTDGMSQAEKELAVALRKNKKPSGTGFF